MIRNFFLIIRKIVIVRDLSNSSQDLNILVLGMLDCQAKRFILFSEFCTKALDFEYMMSSEYLDVQLYGLMGLYWVNPSRFAELISQYRSKTQTSMKYFSGCSGYRQSVAKTAIDISEHLAFSYAITFTEYDDLMLELDLSQIETETIVRMQERLPPALNFCI